ncbi:hypothetical protein F5Y19DRAFT_121940 [Xylariaceae sp. FL1651]|nr:hypothetical protein F5Y19DRAFT_121940 [Xylariaceae sp. FL1651]
MAAEFHSCFHSHTRTSCLFQLIVLHRSIAEIITTLGPSHYVSNITWQEAMGFNMRWLASRNPASYLRSLDARRLHTSSLGHSVSRVANRSRAI